MKNLNIILIVTLFFSACQKDVDVTIPYEGDKLVLNSLFRSDSNIYAKVNVSQKLTRNYNATVPSGVNVELFENGISFGNMPVININGNNYFKSPIVTKPNFIYTLKASAPNYKSVEGTDTVPQKPIATIVGITRPTNNNDDYKLKLQLQDDATKENFYLIKVYKVDSNLTATGPRYNFNDNVNYVYPTYFSIEGITNSDPAGIFGGSEDNQHLLDDVSFNGRNVILNLSIDEYSNGKSHIVVEIISLTKSTYRYLKSVELQNNSQGDPFAEATTIFNNIKNGYGIVGAANDVLVGIRR